MDKTITTLLRSHNLKVTKIRKAVIRLLLEKGVAMSHSEILEALENDKDLDVDKVTLYRTLNTFTELGIAHKVASEDRSWLYAIYEREIHEHDTHEHAHFFCTSCDKIYCFPVENIKLHTSIDNPQGFQINHQEVRLHGTCPICQ